MAATLQPPRAPRTTSRTRRAATRPRRVPALHRRHVGIVIGLLVGAVAMVVVAAMDELSGTRVPVLSTLADAPAVDVPRAIPTRPPPPATPGTCLTWQRTDAADARRVDCARPHLFEQAGAVQLTDFPPGAPLPDNERFRTLVNERCAPLVVTYLDGKYDPEGAFRAGALKPARKRWVEGDRALRCGLQRFSRSGALYPITGKVAGQDQADVRPPGTCLGIDGRFIGDPVDCALPHAIESVGWIDLGEKFTGKAPAVGAQDEYLQPACTKLAGRYAGGDKVISDKKLSVLWDNLTPGSWKAGTRKVGCNLAAQLPDRSGFAPVTGSVKGPVQVGDQAAPPARPAAPPGAPATQVKLPDGEEAQPGPPLEEAPQPVPEPGPQPAPDEPKQRPAPPPEAVRPPAEPPEVKLPEDKLPELPDVTDPDPDREPRTPRPPQAPQAPPNPLGR